MGGRAGGRTWRDAGGKEGEEGEEGGGLEGGGGGGGRASSSKLATKDPYCRRLFISSRRRWRSASSPPRSCRYATARA